MPHTIPQITLHSIQKTGTTSTALAVTYTVYWNVQKVVNENIIMIYTKLNQLNL